MRTNRITLGLAAGIVLLACGLGASAAPPASQTPPVHDVALADGGVFVGQLLSTEGAPLAGVPVALLTGGKQTAQGRTDSAGNFAFSGLRGGMYQVVAAGNVAAYRAWAPGTAPPTAPRVAMIVAGNTLVRGMQGNWLGNPWFLAGVGTVAAVTGIGVADADGSANPPVVNPFSP